MYYLIYLVYAGIACFWLRRCKLSRSAGLEGPAFYGLYFFTVLCSIGFAYFFSHTDPANDYLVYNRHGLSEYKLLLRDPKEFFTDITDSYYADPYGNFFDAGGSFWNDLRNNIIIKIIALFNLLSRGNFYINGLFFSLIAFCGKLALYNFFKRIYPDQRLSLIIGCFLLPSACIFLSGIHKDAVLFCLLAFFSLNLSRLFTEVFETKRFLISIMIFLSILIIRNYVAFVLMPLIVAWIIIRKTKIKPAFIFIAVYALIFLFILLAETAAPDLKPLKVISERQEEFLALPASGTQLQMDTLQPSVKFFVESVPTAVNHVILHPYPAEFDSGYLQFYAVENLVYILLFLILVLFPRRLPADRVRSTVILYCICLSGTMFLFIGYTIPAVGAIIRYKSLYLPFLITPVLAGINWERLIQFQKR